MGRKPKEKENEVEEEMQGMEEKTQEEPSKKDGFSPYHTIRIMRAKDDPAYVDFNISGTLGPGKDGRFLLRGMLPRGRDVQNVPDCVLKTLTNAVEVKVRMIERPNSEVKSGEEGHEMERNQSNSYDFSVIDTYVEKRPKNPKYGFPIFLSNME